MPKVTIDVNDDKLKLLLEVADVLDINREHIDIDMEVPAWHKHILKERLGEYNAGKAFLTAWEDVEKELDNEEANEV